MLLRKEVHVMKRFEIRLDKNIHEKLRAESFKSGKSMHQIIMQLIAAHYAKKEDKGEKELRERI